MVPLLNERYDVTAACWDSRHYNTNPLHFVRGSSTWDAFGKLADATLCDHDFTSMLSKLRYMDSTRNSGNSGFEKLPPELLDMIFSELVDYADSVAVGLCSQSLWRHFLEFAKRDCRRAPWAGTPLVCTGTYLINVPEVIQSIVPYTKQQEDDFLNRPGRGNRGAPSRGMCPARRWNWNAIRSYRDLAEHDQATIRLEAFKTMSLNSNIAATDLVVLEASLRGVVFAMPPVTGTTKWLLRNHTAMEYVRLTVHREHASQAVSAFVENVPALSLDQALMLRVCWGGASTYGLSSPKARAIESIAHGTWAGHCFDVVSEKEPEVGTCWRDVTRVLVREAEDFAEQLAANSEGVS